MTKDDYSFYKYPMHSHPVVTEFVYLCTDRLLNILQRIFTFRIDKCIENIQS